MRDSFRPQKLKFEYLVLSKSKFLTKKKLLRQDSLRFTFVYWNVRWTNFIENYFESEAQES